MKYLLFLLLPIWPGIDWNAIYQALRHDTTMTGEGSDASPLKVDTTIVSTRAYANNIDAVKMFTNTSDATSHTVTMDGYSLKLIEGTNISLATLGTSDNGTVTISATGASLSDGDKGDVTVASGVIDIDAGVVGDNELGTGIDVTQLADGTVTSAELQYINSLTSNAQTQISAKAPIASPTFTGTVTIPAPFTLGATSVTSTGAQLNYLNAAIGTTGTASTNLVFSTSPTLVTPVLGAATATTINGATITSGTLNGSVTGTNTGDGDYLSVLASAEIAITTTATATISRQHLISGTTSNYTVTLPAASGNTGKYIGIRISPSATKLFTIDGNASETIDGSLTRIMWSGESATLYCDGSNWFKIAGRTRPTQAKIYYTSASTSSIADATVVGTPFNSTTIDNTGLMADLTNDRINVIRPGQYIINGQITYSGAANASTGVTANSLNTQTRINKNGSLIANTSSFVSSGATSYPAILSVTVDVAANSTDYYTTHAYQTSGATQYFFTSENLLSVTEIPSW